MVLPHTNISGEPKGVMLLIIKGFNYEPNGLESIKQLWPIWKSVQ